jgi:dihydroorotate dehydrogenase
MDATGSSVHYGSGHRVDDAATELEDKVDLGVDYLGVRFKNPIVVTSCSFTRDIDSVLGLVDAGVGGIVTKTISANMLPQQETVYLEHRNLQFVPSDQRLALDEAVTLISGLKQRTDVPVVANLISYSDHTDKWVELAQEVQDAGADLIEVDLNAHLTRDQQASGSPEAALFAPPSIGGSPEMVKRVVDAVAGAVSIPVVTKLSPVTTDLIGIAKAAIAGGTDGLSLLNAIVGLPGVDIHRGGRPLYDGLDVQGGSMLVGNAIGPSAMWTTAQLGKLFDTPVLSGGGVMNGEQIVERILLGAHLVGVCAVLYRDGNEVVGRMLSELEAYLQQHDYSSTEAFRGDALAYVGMSQFWAFSGATA